MSAMTRNTRRVLANLENSVTMWMCRAYSLNELRDLNDRELRDIGLSHACARWEAAKPFLDCLEFQSSFVMRYYEAR